ncbi:hypothetical protein MNBD_GAMMA10-694 [hydrothermal vent metagenome]|uniref:Peptidase M48 domain-containing protein n=1 Tax=hydrothermal vent metagenome TaxID=652676 RepID=A0A3B0Y061_9ZZZZ
MNDALDRLERNILTNDELNVERQESIAHRHPGAYQFFLTCITIAGYTFIFGLPIIVLLLSAFIPKQIISAADFVSVSVIFIEIAIALIAASLSATLFQLKTILPPGRPLSPDEAPKLIALIDELNLSYSPHKRQPKIQQIKISQNFEIAVIKTPKNGFPVFFTNTLVLGLPLLQCHSPKQLKNLISHEIIRLSGSRSRLSSWLYFSGSYWKQYNLALKKQVKSPNIFLLIFFAWFSPLYQLLAQEVEKLECLNVDKLLNDKISSEDLSDALIQYCISLKYLNDSFWPNLNEKAYRHKTPPYLPYTNIERSLKSKLDDITRQSWLDSALFDTAEQASTPSLVNRLKQLNINNPSLPGALQNSAAAYFLGDTLPVLIQQMDKIWKVSNQFIWQKKYTRGQSERADLSELTVQADQGLLSDERIWDYIQLIKRHKDEQQAAINYKEILKLNTQDPRISFEIGKTLLEQMDNDGIKALERTMQQEAGYTVMACQVLTRYYSRIGDNRSAQSCRRRSLAHQVNAV